MLFFDFFVRNVAIAFDPPDGKSLKKLRVRVVLHNNRYGAHEQGLPVTVAVASGARRRKHKGGGAQVFEVPVVRR